MAASLDSLAKHRVLVWLACIAWALIWALLPLAYHFIAWPLVLAVAIIAALAVFDHLLRFAPLRNALKARGLRGTPGRGEKALGRLQLASAGMMIASIVLDLDSWIFMPLFLSAGLPQMLKARADEEAFLRRVPTTG